MSDYIEMETTITITIYCSTTMHLQINYGDDVVLAKWEVSRDWE